LVAQAAAAGFAARFAMGKPQNLHADSLRPSTIFSDGLGPWGMGLIGHQGAASAAVPLLAAIQSRQAGELPPSGVERPQVAW